MGREELRCAREVTAGVFLPKLGSGEVRIRTLFAETAHGKVVAARMKRAPKLSYLYLHELASWLLSPGTSYTFSTTFE